KKSVACCRVAPTGEAVVARTGAALRRRDTRSVSPATTRRMNSRKVEVSIRIDRLLVWLQMSYRRRKAKKATLADLPSKRRGLGAVSSIWFVGRDLRGHLLRNHPDGSEPLLHQRRPLGNRKFRAPQPKAVSALRIQMQLDGDPGVPERDGVSH